MSWKPLRHLSAATATLALAMPAAGQVSFSEQTGARGITATQVTEAMGGGLAAADFDDDGDVDFFVPNLLGNADQLWRNDGAGSFTDIAASANLDSTESARAALFFDYDGDTRLDLLVAADCQSNAANCPGLRELRLYRQIADGIFTDVTTAAGVGADFIASSDQIGGLAAGDLDGDGNLDFIVSTWALAGTNTSRLFLNDGDGTFTDASSGSGLDTATEARWQPMLHDFDGDGSLDIYQNVDFNPNRLFLNDGSAGFSDGAVAAAADNDMNDMGITLGDPDRDGDFDVYITNVESASDRNVLLQNDSVGAALSFTEISVAAGVSSGQWGWGTTFFDADNDGWEDLVATNGFGGAPWSTDTTRFFRNLSTVPATFANESASAGLDDAFWGSTMVAADLDRDGDLDLLQSTVPGPHRLLDNQSAGLGNYLVIKPRMYGPNHRAIGAVVRATVGGAELIRLISAGTSFQGQQPAEAFFGLGTATGASQVSVDWPDGSTTTVYNVAGGQALTVESDCSDPNDNDGDGIGDDCDVDDDNDGLLDVVESGTGTYLNPSGTGSDPLVRDSDGDGASDGSEVAAGTDPNDAGSTPPTVPALGPAAQWLVSGLLGGLALVTLGTRSRRRAT